MNILISCDIRCGLSQIEVTIRLWSLLITDAQAVAAMPEKPTPPRVNFSGSSRAAARLAE